MKCHLSIRKDPDGYTITQEPTKMDVLTVKHQTTAKKYLRYLVAGGLQWNMTEQPQNPRDKDLPEVVRYVRLRDATFRWRRVLCDIELDELLRSHNG
jgi:hypothetical protein